MKERDYTRRKYSRLIECLASHYQTFSIVDYCLAKDNQCLPEKYFIVRHDVDGNVRNALTIAQIDAYHGIRATFYFRMKPYLFNPHIIRNVALLGHEIGYHYEVLADTRGNLNKARMLFEENLKKLRSISQVKTVCMHGRSLSLHNNLDFWKRFTLQEFDIIAEPYLTIDYSDKYYFSDTSFRWDNSIFNIRDIVKSRGNLGIKSSDELIDLLGNENIFKGSILTHSNFWVDSKLTWWINRILFFGINNIKRVKKNLLKQRSGI